MAHGWQGSVVTEKKRQG